MDQGGHPPPEVAQEDEPQGDQEEGWQQAHPPPVDHRSQLFFEKFTVTILIKLIKRTAQRIARCE